MPDPNESTPRQKLSSLRKGMERAAEWRREVEATLAAGDVDAAADLTLKTGIPSWIRAERAPWIAILEAFVRAAAAGGPAAPRAAQAGASIAKDMDRQRGLDASQRQRIVACKSALWQFVVTGAGLPAVPPFEELLAAAEVLYKGQLYVAAAAAVRELALFEPNDDGQPLRRHPLHPFRARLEGLCNRIELACEHPNRRNRRDWLRELAYGEVWRQPEGYDPEPVPGEAARPRNVLAFPTGPREEVN